MIIKLMALPGLPAVLHLIVGIETEMSVATEGCAYGGNIMELLSKLEPGTPVLLKLTRCESEQDVVEFVAAQQARQGLQDQFGAQVCGDCAGAAEPKLKPKAKPGAKAKVCKLCGTADADTDIPGMQICGSCAAIEIGRAQEIVAKLGGKK